MSSKSEGCTGYHKSEGSTGVYGTNSCATASLGGAACLDDMLLIKTVQSKHVSPAPSLLEKENDSAAPPPPHGKCLKLSAWFCARFEPFDAQQKLRTRALRRDHTSGLSTPPLPRGGGVKICVLGKSFASSASENKITQKSLNEFLEKNPVWEECRDSKSHPPPGGSLI